MLVQFSCGSGGSMLSSNLKEEVCNGCLEFLFYLLLIDNFKTISFSRCKYAIEVEVCFWFYKYF